MGISSNICAQCYTTSGDVITFNATIQNNDPAYGALYILTDYKNVILDTTSNNSFPAQSAGLFHIYGCQYLASQYPLVDIGSSISLISGSCIDISAPFEILVCPEVNSCNTFDGNFNFNATAGNIDFTTSFILTDLEKNILKVNTLPSFTTIDTGIYLVFALNYIDMNGLIEGSHLDSLVSSCLDISNPLIIRSCEACEVFLGDDFELCFPQTVILTASSTSLGNYTWSSGQTGATISVSPDVTTTYIVTFTATNGCQLTEEITINVNFPPVANAGLDRDICAGQSVTLTAELVLGASYQWSNGANTRSILVNPNTTQNYAVTVTVGDCSAVDAVLVSVSDCGAVSGLVWEDLNGNGIYELGENGIPNIPVRLFNDLGVQVALTFSDMNGNYLFANVVSGDYSIMFDKPNDFQFTASNQGGNDDIDSDANVSTGITPIFSVLAQDTISNLFSGYYKFARLENFVWDDENKNGIQDIGEGGLGNVMIMISGESGSGSEVMDTTMTNPMGMAMFDDIVPGNYVLKFELPNDTFKRSPANIALDDAKDSDADELDGTTEMFALLSGDDIPLFDAGFYRCAYIGDYVWLDNGDEPNVQDDGDLGLDGIDIYLFDASFPSQPIDTTFSAMRNGIAGFYSFELCDIGDYFIKVAPNSNYDLVMPTVGMDNNLDSDITDRINGQSDILNITYGLVLNNIDIGFQFKPLPIDLIDFYGAWNREKNVVNLNWITASEINTDYFEVMRSVNGTVFEKVNKVKANGNSNFKKLYELIDNQIKENGLYLYKLISYDFDGYKEVSKTIGILVHNHVEYSVKIYPNPAISNLNINFSGIHENQQYLVEIFDILGRVVYTHSINSLTESLTRNLSIDVSGLNDGNYYIKINMDENVFIRKLIVQR